jgi:DNA repair protein RadA/Sms
MVVGEIGLTGEVRPVSRMEERLREGVKMGFNRCLLPRGNVSSNLITNIKELEKDLEMIDVSTLAQALNLAFD